MCKKSSEIISIFIKKNTLVLKHNFECVIHVAAISAGTKPATIAVSFKEN